MMDGGAIGGDGGRWRDGVRVRAWVFAAVLDNGGKKKEQNGLCWLIVAVLDSFPIFIFFN